MKPKNNKIIHVKLKNGEKATFYYVPQSSHGRIQTRNVKLNASKRSYKGGRKIVYRQPNYKLKINTETETKVLPANPSENPPQKTCRGV